MNCSLRPKPEPPSVVRASATTYGTLSAKSLDLRRLLNVGTKAPSTDTSQSELQLAPRARASHPQTSHDAARSVTDLRPKQQAVLKVFQWRGKIDGLTHEELIRLYSVYHHFCGYAALPNQSESGLRTRCSELVSLGKLHDSGERREISTGRKAIVWKLNS